MRVGFDGVEILLNPFTKSRVSAYRSLARNLGATLHFHQAWSVEEDPTELSFRLMGAARYLPQNGYKLRDHIPASITEPVVIQADRYDEARDHPNWWLQIQSVLGSDREYKLAFERFVEIFHRLDRPPVVFDTQHYIEYVLGFWGIEHLPTDKKYLLSLLSNGWKIFGKWTKEIHLNDCHPGLGHRGRNVLPGDGVLPLKEFCQLVKSSGWDGTIVSEISPGHLLPYTSGKLANLRERISLFIA